MANQVELEFSKTYKTEKNAIAAVTKEIEALKASTPAEDFITKKNIANVRYVVVPVVGEKEIRYGVVFIGITALDLGLHFRWNVIA